jgi:DNA-binding NtrC family response regulator
VHVTTSSPRNAILIIDDDPWIASYTKDVIEMFFPFDVFLATTAEQARQQWRLHGSLVSMVICDVCLPGITGESLMAEFLKDRPGLPLLFSTGHIRDEEELSRQLGQPVSVVLKPFKPQDLVSALQKHLDVHSQSGMSLSA